MQSRFRAAAPAAGAVRAHSLSSRSPSAAERPSDLLRRESPAFRKGRAAVWRVACQRSLSPRNETQKHIQPA